jgi:DNA-binding MarR family transcriptional regulator
VTNDTPLDAEEFAAYLALREVASLLEHGVEQQFREDGGIGGAQFAILVQLANSPTGQARMTDLADSLVYSRSGLTYQAGQMEKAGLITRAPAEDDERSIIVELTPAGREVLDRVMPGHLEVVRRLFFQWLSRDEVLGLADLMPRLRDHMRTAPPRSQRPRKPSPGRSPRSSG